MPEGAPLGDESLRASRSLLSTTATIPRELIAKYDIPDLCHVHKTVFRDKTLPHYQAKLLGGRVFEGKSLRSINAVLHLLCIPCVRIPDTKAKAINKCILQPVASADGYR